MSDARKSDTTHKEIADAILSRKMTVQDGVAAVRHLGRIGALADNLRCAAWGVASKMVLTPGADAYEYRGSTNAVVALMVALNELEDFQAGWR